MTNRCYYKKLNPRPFKIIFYFKHMTSFIFGLLILSAWLTHIVHCFTEGSWGFLIGGALFVPIAVVHGIGLWLGLW